MAFRKKPEGQTDLSRLKQELESGQLRPVYLIYGEEAGLCEEAICLLNQALIPEQNDLDRRTIDVASKPAQLNFAELQGDLELPPFMARQRVLILRESDLFELTKTYQEETKRLIDIATKSRACLIFLEKHIDRRSALTKRLQAEDAIYHMAAMNEFELNERVQSYAKQAGVELGRELTRELIACCESDWQRIQRECKKLFLYARSQQKDHLELKDAASLLQPGLFGDVFALIDALAQKRATEALRIHQVLLARKEAPHGFLVLVARQLRELLCCQSMQGLSREERLELLGLKGNMAWKLDKLERQAKAFSSDELSELIKALRDTDLALRQTGEDEETLVQKLIVKACQKRKTKSL